MSCLVTNDTIYQINESFLAFTQEKRQKKTRSLFHSVSIYCGGKHVRAHFALTHADLPNSSVSQQKNGLSVYNSFILQSKLYKRHKLTGFNFKAKWICTFFRGAISTRGTLPPPACFKTVHFFEKDKRVLFCHRVWRILISKVLAS